ncbi:hypothetical protein WNZ15_18655 [Roseibium sp. AS2]|uniref:hypothetical protein n=1 Tax=Roseibium sp. AS2 TaxID=3135781 RepID=UPI0031725DC4
MTLIETRPTAVMFGEFYERESITISDVNEAAPPLPENYCVVDTAEHEQKLQSLIYRPIALPFQEDEEKNCLWMCLTGGVVPEIAVTGIGAISSGSVPKSWVGLPRGAGPTASRFTSVTSIIAHKVPSLGKVPVPKSIPNKAPVFGGPKIVKMSSTKSLLRFVGRWIPGIGWGLLAADLVILDQCIANCSGERSFLRAACEELTPFCIKSAY